VATILIIDDNETIREGLAHVVKKMGHLPMVARSGKEGIERFKQTPADFVITDLKMEGLDGVAVVRSMRELDPDCPAMIITAFGTIETAVEAMKLGAFDFLIKPFAPEVVRLKVERALELRAARRSRGRLEAENAYLRQEESVRFGEIVGSSEPMRRVFGVVERVAPTDTSVAIYGESGTGKELVARAIHQRSRRASGPFIKVNCGALVETLLESELFGHEKGAFTGAIKRKLGRFELADGGTLFLDEIGDVSPAMQTKLLRVLQERDFERVGGENSIKVDVRVLSATNKDLAKEVAEGRFREDLYYRLQVVPVTISPLRERKGDIPLLAEHFLRRLAPKTNPRVSGIDDAALARLIAYRWPGNVRELENVIEQALVFSDGEHIAVESLPVAIRGDASAGALPAAVHDRLPMPSGEMALPDLLDDLERQLILKAYAQAKGIKTETARLLGIKTSALYYKLEKYGIG
jgi:two-component system, NtrC family, response regulator HydG